MADGTALTMEVVLHRQSNNSSAGIWILKIIIRGGFVMRYHIIWAFFFILPVNLAHANLIFDNMRIDSSGKRVGGGTFINFTVINGSGDNPGKNVNDFHVEIKTANGVVDANNSKAPTDWVFAIPAGHPEQGVWNTSKAIAPGDFITDFILVVNLLDFTLLWNTTLDDNPQKSGEITFKQGSRVEAPASILILLLGLPFLFYFRNATYS